MKRFFKVLVCSAVFLSGVLVNRQEAKAQFVVSDPQNLVQSILQYIQDQVREGNFDGLGLSKLEGMREQFKAQKEKLDQVMLVVGKYQQFRQAYNDIEVIAVIVCSYQSVATAGNLIKRYGLLTDSLMGEAKDEMFDISKITQADPMTMLSELRRQTEYLYAGYGYIRRSFYDAFRQAYYDDMARRASEADQALLKSLFY